MRVSHRPGVNFLLPNPNWIRIHNTGLFHVHKNVVFFSRGFNLKRKFPPSLRVTSTEKNCFPLPPPLSPPGWRLLPQGEISLLQGNIYDRALFAEVGTIELRVDMCW